MLHPAIIITKADKGNVIVALLKTQYQELTLSIHFYNLQQKINNVIFYLIKPKFELNLTTFKLNLITPEEGHLLRTYNATPPGFYVF